MYLNEAEMHFGVNDILNMWKDVPATRLLDIKLKCVFEQSDSELAKHEQKNEKTFQSPNSQQVKQESRSQLNRNSNNEENGKLDTVSNQTNLKTTQLSSNNNNSSRLDKNENLVNELIQVRHENELLKKEINKLKVIFYL